MPELREIHDVIPPIPVIPSEWAGLAPLEVKLLEQLDVIVYYYVHGGTPAGYSVRTIAGPIFKGGEPIVEHPALREVVSVIATWRQAASEGVSDEEADALAMDSIEQVLWEAGLLRNRAKYVAKENVTG